MNSIEAMMLREDAAGEYLSRLQISLINRYSDRLEAIQVLDMIEDGISRINSGQITLNEALADTLDLLDEFDNDDCFGTWGWRHSVMGEDS